MADQGVDLVVTSGGLGPTADDLTLEVVARFAGRPLHLDEALEAAHRGHPRAAHEALAQPRLRGRARGQPQAGAGPRGRDRDRARGHRAGHGGAPSGRRPARPSWSCPARRASCTRCGTRPSRPRRSERRSAQRDRLRRSRCCACSASPSPRSPRRCAWPRRRSTASSALEITTCLRRGEVEVVVRHEPVARPRLDRAGGADRRAPRRHALLHRRLDRRRAGGRAAGRADGGHWPSPAPAG